MVLLVVAALDIGVPGHSLTETHEHSTAAAQAWCGGGVAATADSPTSPAEVPVSIRALGNVATSGNAAFHHDDCFGCCANILPEHVIRLMSSSDEAPGAVEVTPGDRPPLTARIFHPPNA